jgi:hypothetical protein
MRCNEQENRHKAARPFLRTHRSNPSVDRWISSGRWERACKPRHTSSDSGLAGRSSKAPSPAIGSRGRTRVSDHERIWLEPECCTDYRCADRIWCEDNVWPTGDCDALAEPTEYIRADLAATLTRKLAMAEAALEPFELHLRDSMPDHRCITTITHSAGDYRKVSEALFEIREQHTPTATQPAPRHKS